MFSGYTGISLSVHVSVYKILDSVKVLAGVLVTALVNSPSNNKVLQMCKLTEITNKKVNVAQKLQFKFESVENIVGNLKNAGYQHSHKCFQGLPFCCRKLGDWFVTSLPHNLIF